MRLKYYREAKKMSQKELSLQLGVNQNTISQWETGVRTPRTDKLPLLSQVLGCTTDELLKGEEKQGEEQCTKEENIRKA